MFEGFGFRDPKLPRRKCHLCSASCSSWTPAATRASSRAGAVARRTWTRAPRWGSSRQPPDAWILFSALFSKCRRRKGIQCGSDVCSKDMQTLHGRAPTMPSEMQRGVADPAWESRCPGEAAGTTTKTGATATTHSSKTARSSMASRRRHREKERCILRGRGAGGAMIQPGG